MSMIGVSAGTSHRYTGTANVYRCIFFCLSSFFFTIALDFHSSLLFHSMGWWAMMQLLEKCNDQ